MLFLQLKWMKASLICVTLPHLYVPISSIYYVLFFDQVELWFPSERDLPVPGDPTEPLAYDRLANLKKVMQQVKILFWTSNGVIFFIVDVFVHGTIYIFTCLYFLLQLSTSPIP